MTKPIAFTPEPIRSLDELAPLVEFEVDPRNPMSPGATRHAVRKDSGRPEFRAALIRAGKRDIVHIPSWLKAFEAYRVKTGEAA